MNSWITSDTHFFHKNILKYCKNTRPFSSVEEMNEALITNWNSLVKKDDIVYHLGDFGFAPASQLVEIIKRLNGTIYFVPGNHDEQMFDPQITKLIRWIKPYHEVGVNRTKVCLFHYPIHKWNQMHRGAVHFHGHLHSQRVFGRSKDVGVDSNNCFPYNLEDLVVKMKQLEIVCESHEK